MTLWGESEQDISSHCKHMTLHTVSNVWISDYIHYIHNRVLCTAQKRNWAGRLRQTHTKCKLKRTRSYQASIVHVYESRKRTRGILPHDSQRDWYNAVFTATDKLEKQNKFRRRGGSYLQVQSIPTEGWLWYKQCNLKLCNLFTQGNDYITVGYFHALSLGNPLRSWLLVWVYFIHSV